MLFGSTFHKLIFMMNSYSQNSWIVCTGLMLAPLGSVLAQAPVITAVTPMANATAVARTSPIIVNFNQPLPPAAAGALKVFSAQRGGQRARGTTPATVNGSTLSFEPRPYSFLPGETIYYTVTTSAASSGGALGQARVGQFTVAAGSSTGIFQAGPAVAVSQSPTDVAVGDVDGDGDLDMLTANGSNTIELKLNNGKGT
ncbi:MAG: hypothetical protein EOO62_38810, partial [Hymenobacter sp.]